jgi:hypothetical protein
MNMYKTSFPVYRKYADEHTFFKIDSAESFSELRRMGKYYSLSQIQAQNYADRLMINDMVILSSAHYLESTEVEFNRMLKEWSTHLQPYPTGLNG